MQEVHPLEFTNKNICDQNLGKSTYKKDMLVILHVVDMWSPYLIGMCFYIKTSNDSLNYFLEYRLSSPKKHKWVTKMHGYDYEIIYQKGKENVVVDALSRKYEDEGSLFSLSLPLLDWLVEVHHEWFTNGRMVQLINQL